MSDHHNYTNPAFCQQSEYFPALYGLQSRRISPAKVHRSESVRSVQHTRTIQQQQNANEHSPQRVGSIRHLPPRPGPKPQINLAMRYAPTTTPTASFTSCSPEKRARYDQPDPTAHKSAEGYALVPLADIPCTDKGRYAYIPAREANLMRSTSTRRITKSQDDLDRSSSLHSSNATDFHDSSFTSLPPLPKPRFDTSNNATSPRMKSAFSTDFVANKSLILVDQKSMQRYAIVPTEEDEELVDANHEIIQMHNGRAHRYAVIPAAEEEAHADDKDDDDDAEEQETCLSSDNDFNSPHNDKYATIKEMPNSLRQKYATSTPQKHIEIIQRTVPDEGIQITPSKSAVATQKLFEILSTPRKTPVAQHHLDRRNSTNHSTYSTTSTPSHRYRSQIISSTPKHSDFIPQQLHYGTQRRPHHELRQQQQPNPKIMSAAVTVSSASQYEQQQQRSTAIISPRLAQQYASQYSVEAGADKSWSAPSEYKVSQATATIGAVSLMLILGGAMNSGLCLYMITVFGRLYYLDLGIVSGFAAASLGLLGFKSRQSEWLPNRNYISGYILVTVFSLLNCTGLLVLLALRPVPGTPLHDVTTGVILGLSSLTLLIISLGVITSRWCRAPPPDNRVDVCNY